jgi:nucleoside 2-deoxyribosyltransferase
MNIYLAASWAQREVMRDRRTDLEALGHKVTSRWIDSEDESGMGPDEIASSPDSAAAGAWVDIYDIDRSELVVVFADVPSSTGGYHFEFGFAIGRGKNVAAVGPNLNVFFSLPLVGNFPNWPEFLRWLKTI